MFTVYSFTDYNTWKIKIGKTKRLIRKIICLICNWNYGCQGDIYARLNHNYANAMAIEVQQTLTIVVGTVKMYFGKIFINDTFTSWEWNIMKYIFFTNHLLWLQVIFSFVAIHKQLLHAPYRLLFRLWHYFYWRLIINFKCTFDTSRNEAFNQFIQRLNTACMQYRFIDITVL